MNTLLSGERMQTDLAKKAIHLSNYVRFTNEGKRIILGYDLSKERIERKLKQVQQESNRRFSYYSYLQSSEWRKLRRKVIIRAKGICEHCGLASVEEIHHLTYKRFKKELLSDLLGVCSDCHEKIHNIKNEHLIPLVFGGD